MGIGYLDINGKGDTYTGCQVDDVQSGCMLWMWDNYTDSECKVSLSVKECIKLRNYLNMYIESYANTSADDGG